MRDSLPRRYSKSVAQQIEHPHGVTTFGSHIVRVTPDLATVTAAINRMAAAPADAFKETREVTRRVRDFLRSAGVDDREVRSSQITLETKYRRVGGVDEFVGHRASVEVSVTLVDLTKLEDVLVGIVDEGADQVRRVQFRTTKLREHRATARAKALEAARAKAQVYCDVGGVKVGKLLHIEDVDPTRTGRRGYGHVVDQDFSDSADNDPGAYHPGAITVSGAVVASYAIL